MRSVKAIFESAPKVRNILRTHRRYLAHTASEGENRPDELLDEHVELVNRFVERLVAYHGLDAVIDDLINSVCANLEGASDRKLIGEDIKERFVYSILFHDFGKVNDNYQRERLNNTAEFPNAVEAPFFPLHGHSQLSAYMYLRYYAPNGFDDTDLILFWIALLFAYPIIRHHAPSLHDIQDYYESVQSNWENNNEVFTQFYQRYELSGNHRKFEQCLQHIKAILQEGKKFTKQNEFPLFALIKLLFSLLTAADFLATSVYANDKDYSISGTIDPALRQRILQAVPASAAYNKEILNRAEDERFVFERPLELGKKFLNQLRSEMGVEVIRNIRANQRQKLFYIEAPTGGGKTNLSMLAAAELLRLKSKLNKVVYVFPFTTLVTQTHRALKHTFDLKEEEITQLHSKAGYPSRHNQAEEEKDGHYGADKQNYLTYLFNHFPVTLCTHIRFFDWMKSDRKETNYALHRLANAIVIIDELQAYNPKHWDKVIFFVEQYARYFNTHFIIMSATLPKLGDLLNRLTEGNQKVLPLVKNAKEHFFRNPNFRNRVIFDLSLLSGGERMTVDRLANEVLTKSQVYAQNNGLYPDSVYCIVECIYKRSATDLYDAIAKRKSFFDHVWVLSGTILEHRRRTIINRLKNEEQYRKKKILLITTQVVEAGVDIDMDIGFKDQSIIDSDEQLAGRINRNVSKRNCRLYLFRMDKARVLYKDDLRYQICREKFRKKDLEAMLHSKDFDQLYEKVFEAIARKNDSHLEQNHDQYRRLLQKLDFRAISREFRLIENDNFSLFVPLALPLTIEGQKAGEEEKMFSEDELAFLKKRGVAVDKSVPGDQVFDLYLKYVKRKIAIEDYIEQKTDFIRLRGLMSRFVFSMFASDAFLKKITPYLGFDDDEEEDKSEFGYLYLAAFQEIYDEKTGLRQEVFDQITSQFLF